jgi:Na+-driven multidrug efflux pump
VAELAENSRHLESTRDHVLPGTAIRFSASILVGLLAGMVLQIWTLAFLGHLGGEALYIRAIYTPVSFLVLAVTEGISVASQVSAGIATRNGRRDVLRPLPTYATVSWGLLLLIALAFTAGQRVVFSVLSVGTADRHMVVAFVTTMCLASMIGLLPGMAGSMLRGMGRPGTSSVLAAGSVALTIVVMVVLRVTTDLGVLAVPAGTAVAAVLTGAATFAVMRGDFRHIPGLRVRRDDLRDLRTFGLPVAGTFLLLSVVNSGYLRVLRNAGVVGISGFNLGQNANSLFMVVSLAIGSGVAVAANLHGGDDRRPVVQAGLTTTVRMALPAYAVIGGLIYLFCNPLAALLTSDKAVAAVGATYFMWMGPSFTGFGGTLALLTYLEQVGRASTALILNTIYFAVMLAIAFALPQPVSSTDLIRVIAASNIVGFVTCWMSARYLIRRSRWRYPRDTAKS